MEIKEVKSILEDWGLPHLIESFHDNGVDVEAFQCLTDDLIKELIPKIGDRAKFFNHYNKIYRVSFNIVPDTLGSNVEYLDVPSSQSSTTASVEASSFDAEELDLDFLNDEPLENVPIPYKEQNKAFYIKRGEDLLIEPISTYDFNLKSFLEGSVEGLEVLSASGSFTESIRNKLVTLIINNELTNAGSSKIISTERFKQLARLIKQLFPKENIGTYYTPYTCDIKGKYKRCARGKLFDKYHNRRRRLRDSGLLKTIREREESQSEEIKTIPLEEEETKIWLQHNTEPWPEIYNKWKFTYNVRFQILNSLDSVDNYFKQFPSLKKPLGFTLLETDFDHQYKNLENKVFVELPKLIDKIFILARQSTDTNIKEFLKINIDSEEEKTAVGLIIYPYLFGKNYIVNIKGKSKKIKWKPSKLEIQESFITHLKSANDLRPHLERRNRKYLELKETCQPVILLVGDSLKKYETLISINDILYSVDNLLKAVDVTFKIFHVLRLKYPVECDHCWSAIQKIIYNISTPWDNKHICVNSLLSDLDQIKDDKNE